MAHKNVYYAVCVCLIVISIAILITYVLIGIYTLCAKPKYPEDDDYISEDGEVLAMVTKCNQRTDTTLIISSMLSIIGLSLVGIQYYYLTKVRVFIPNSASDTQIVLFEKPQHLDLSLSSSTISARSPTRSGPSTQYS